MGSPQPEELLQGRGVSRAGTRCLKECAAQRPGFSTGNGLSPHLPCRGGGRPPETDFRPTCGLPESPLSLL